MADKQEAQSIIEKLQREQGYVQVGGQVVVFDYTQLPDDELAAEVTKVQQIIDRERKEMRRHMKVVWQLRGQLKRIKAGKAAA